MSTTRTRKAPAACAARRRNLACRPLALGRHHGAHESLPLTATNQPAGIRRPYQPRRSTVHSRKSRASGPADRPRPNSSLTARPKARRRCALLRL